MLQRIDPNAIGDRGEGIFNLVVTRRHGQERPLFRPRFLGEKYPIIDFIVEVLDVGGLWTPYFFVQAKATQRGYTARQERLKASISEDRLRQLVRYPAPTYVVGIDEVLERCYILAAVHGQTTSISSFPVDYDLGQFDILNLLRQDVLDFWRDNGREFIQSRFSDRNPR